MPVRPPARRTPSTAAYRRPAPARARPPADRAGNGSGNLRSVASGPPGTLTGSMGVGLAPPSARNDWVGLTAEQLPLDDALRWAGLPGCGAAVLFTGNVRDLSRGRPGVTASPTRPTRKRSCPGWRPSPPRPGPAGPTSAGWCCCTASATSRVGEVVGGRRGVGAAPGRGVRRGPVLHRHPEGHRPHLEAGGVGRRRGLVGRATPRHRSGHRAVSTAEVRP